ncbi:MAG: c-type cytochrome [Bryobacterales bacterium]|nr:c-type cytochrome [Acidobacteriota bacterium]MCB9384951.1 c-type cytochrome [Bryobacterales bacterium]
MRAKIAAPALLALGLAVSAIAQGPPRRGPRPPEFPAQQRELADEATITRGEQIYTANCRFCHGADLRGGDSGGPNLLRSKLVFNDKEGELIGPVVIQGSNTPGGGMMPPIPMPPADIKALAGYLHKVQSTMRGQGNPPEGGEKELNVLVGDVNAGKDYFASTCASCHKASDMKGLSAKFPEAMDLQNYWVRGSGDPRVTGKAPSPSTVVVKQGGKTFEGELVRYDDFTVSLKQKDGQYRSFSRTAGPIEVEIDDPKQAHLNLLPKYQDKNIHDVTAYLASLK